MAHPPEFLDDIRERIVLSELISRRVNLQRRGNEHVGLCPFHNEKTPSFTVNDMKGFFHCFGCGAHGDVIGFTMQSEGLPFVEAVENLAAMAGLQVPKSSPEAVRQQQRRAELSEVMERACSYYEACLNSPNGLAAREYLQDRGLSEETISRFRLGYAPPGNGLKQALTSDTIPEALLMEAGLVKRSREREDTYDFFRRRVMFPIFNRRGQVIAFGGRVTGDGEPKYLNSPETPLFDKGRTLYGHSLAQRAARERGRLIVTEGYMDVIILSQAGFEETVAPLGTALGENHIRMLWQMCNEPVLCFDGDPAGRRAAARVALRAMPLLQPDHSLRFATIPAGEDPDSLVRAHGPPALEKVIGEAESLSSVIWALETEGRDHDTPERRAGLDRRLENRAHAIEDRKVRFQYQQLFRKWFRELDRGYAGNPRAGPSGLPSGPQPRAGNVTLLRRRYEQVMLCVMINHPWLLDSHVEELARVTMLDQQLDKVLGEIQNALASDSSLDSHALMNQLVENGYQAVLDSLGDAELYVHAPFARKDASKNEVATGFSELLSRRREAALEKEVRHALSEFKQEPTEDNWHKYEKLKSEAQSARIKNRDSFGSAGLSWAQQGFQARQSSEHEAHLGTKGE